MAVFSNPEDALGLKVDDTVIVVDSGGGFRQEPIEQMDETGGMRDDAVSFAEPRDELQTTYDILEGGELEFKFGELVNSDYVLTSLSVTQDPKKDVRAVVNYKKFSSTDKLNVTNSKKFSVVVTGGRGIVDVYGCSIADPGDFTAATLRVSISEQSVVERVGGDYQDEGFAVYGGKLDHTINGTNTITLPAGAHSPSNDKNQARDGFQTYAKAWFTYPVYT